MVDVRGYVLRLPHGTTPAAVKAASDETPSRKRNRSVLSNTPPSAEKRFPKSNNFR